MAKILKGTIVYTGPGRGWTESYYQNRVDNNLVLASNQLREVCNSRVKLLGDGYRIQGWRVSFITNDAGERIRGGSYPIQEEIFPPGNNPDGDFSDTSILIEWKNLDATRLKNTYMRGVWDVEVIGEGAKAKGALYLQYFNDFKAKILQYQYGWYGRVPNTAQVGVLGYLSSATDVVTITMKANIFDAGTIGKPVLVNFTGINTKSRINGQQVVIPTSTTACELKKPLAVGPYVNGGFARVLGYEFVPISEGNMARVVSRKTGRPLFASRGRAPARPRT